LTKGEIEEFMVVIGSMRKKVLVLRNKRKRKSHAKCMAPDVKDESSARKTKNLSNKGKVQNQGTCYRKRLREGGRRYGDHVETQRKI